MILPPIPGHTRALVVGYGSIGKRHARVLSQLGCDVGVVSTKPVAAPTACFLRIEEALIAWCPDLVVLATPTSSHFDGLRSLVDADYRGKVLVEKPLFDRVRQFEIGNISSVSVGYNLRFHPLMDKLRMLLEQSGPALAAHVYAGQYLPDWRPAIDYRESYSARVAMGGGVLRDLSHELDYVTWLFGAVVRVTAHGGKFSGLEIDADDTYCIVAEARNCPVVSINLNYLDRVPRRSIIVHTSKDTIEVNFAGSYLEVNGVREVVAVGQDQTYSDQHRDILNGDFSRICGLSDGLQVLQLIETVEKAALRREWIEP